MPIERSIRRTRRVLWLTTTAAIVSLGMGCVGMVRQSQSDSLRAADKKSQEVAQVAQCFTSVKNAPEVLKILEIVDILGIVDILATNSIKANRQALEAQPESNLSPTRRESLNRLEPARNDLRAFIRRTAENAPTKQSCTKIAADLGVDPSKLNDQ